MVWWYWGGGGQNIKGEEKYESGLRVWRVKRLLSRSLAATLMVGMIALERERHQEQLSHMTRREEAQATEQELELDLDRTEQHLAGAKEMSAMDRRGPVILIKDLAAIILAPIMPQSNQDIRQKMASKTIMDPTEDPLADMEGLQGYLGTRILLILGVAGSGAKVGNLHQKWEGEMKSSMGAGEVG